MELGVLFCDQVGSTDLLTRLGDELAEEIRRDLFEALNRAADICRGEVVKGSGDGLMVVFPAGSDDALRCGELMVRMVARLARRELWSDVQFKVGVSQGEAVFDKGDWYGAAVNLAARLCAVAQPSQVLAMTATVTGSMSVGPEWEPLPPMTLKGFPDPVEVQAHDIVDADVLEWAVPVELDLQGAPPLVGRDTALHELEVAWERATTGSSALISVVGEPGVGVTRALAELAARVGSRPTDPGLVLSARGDVAIPWVAQLVRSLAATTTESDLRVDAGNDAAALASICPLVGLRLGVVPEPELGASDEELLGRLLARLADRAPVLVVLDGMGTEVGAGLGRLLPPIRCLVATGGRADVGTPEFTQTVGLMALGAQELAILVDVVIPTDRPWREDLLDLVAAETHGVPRDVLAAVDELVRSGTTAELTGSVAFDAVRRAVPYKGLQVYSDDDAVRFFGRRRAVDDVMTALAEHEFVVVVGSSGSGKSSVIRAGCLPRLASDNVDVVVMVPGDDPVRTLAAAWCHVVGGSPEDLAKQLRIDPGGLARTATGRGRPVCLVVDQLEESFTLRDDEEERERFLQIITRSVRGLRVLATLRGDFYGRASEHPQLAQALQNGTVVMTPPTEGELRTVIEAPAVAAHLTLEPGLADLILSDVTGRPGGLPLLSHALSATWRLRHGRTLTVSDYRGAGGATGAIARTADSVFDQLSPSEQEVAKRIFLRLTALGEGVEDSGRRVPVSVLVASGTPEGVSVLDTLLAARLVTAGTDAEGTDIDELAHEALLREWPRLRAWLDEDREELRVLAHLESASREWDATGRTETELYAGRRLEAAEEISPDKLNDLERTYLTSSLDHREDERRRARRATRRLKSLVVLLVLLLIASGIAAITATVERNTSVRSNSALLARSLVEDGDKAVATGNSDRAVLLDAQAAHFAARSGGLVSTSDVQAALISSLRANPHLETYLSGLHGAIEDVALSPDGRYAAAIDEQGRVGIWRMSDNRLLATFQGPGEAISLTFMGSDEIATQNTGSVVAYRASDGLARWKRQWLHRVPQAVEMVGGRAGVLVISDVGQGPNDLYAGLLLDPHGKANSVPYLPQYEQYVPVAVSPSGSIFAVAGTEFSESLSLGQITATTNIVINLFTPHGLLVSSFTLPFNIQDEDDTPSVLGFSADGTKVGVVISTDPQSSTSSSSQVIRQINLATGAETNSPVPTDSSASWSPVSISPDLGAVVETDEDTSIPGQLNQAPPRARLGLADVLSHSFTADLAAPGAPTDLLQFSGEIDQNIGAYLSGIPSSAVFLPDGSKVLAAGGLGSVPVFSLAPSERLATVDLSVRREPCRPSPRMGCSSQVPGANSGSVGCPQEFAQ